jgi:hypothetical protein
MNMADAAKGINAITGLVKAPFDIGLGITNAVQRRKERKLQEKQLQQQENQFNKTFAETQKQNTIGNIMAERNQGMKAIDMLANQRYAAMSRFQNQPFRDALFNAMR